MNIKAYEVYKMAENTPQNAIWLNIYEEINKCDFKEKKAS
jgi:hypothetical protein